MRTTMLRKLLIAGVAVSTLSLAACGNKEEGGDESAAAKAAAADASTVTTTPTAYWPWLVPSGLSDADVTASSTVPSVITTTAFSACHVRRCPTSRYEKTALKASWEEQSSELVEPRRRRRIKNCHPGPARSAPSRDRRKPALSEVPGLRPG